MFTKSKYNYNSIPSIRYFQFQFYFFINPLHANILNVEARLYRMIRMNQRLSVVRTGVEAVVEDLCPEKAGAGLLEDGVEASHVSPGEDDVGDVAPVL